MSDKPEITPEKLAELDVNAAALMAHGNPRYSMVLKPDVVAALVREVERLRGDEAQLVALDARATVEGADDALPPASPDPCKPAMSELQDAIRVVSVAVPDLLAGLTGDEQKRRTWDALLTVLDEAEKVPALEARLAKAEPNAGRYEALRYAFSYDSPAGWFDDEPAPEGETDAIVEAMMHEAADLRADALGCTADERPERVAGPEGSAP